MGIKGINADGWSFFTIPLGLQPLPLASKGESYNKQKNKTTKQTPPLFEGRWSKTGGVQIVRSVGNTPP